MRCAVERCSQNQTQRSWLHKQVWQVAQREVSGPHVVSVAQPAARSPPCNLTTPCPTWPAPGRFTTPSSTSWARWSRPRRRHWLGERCERSQPPQLPHRARQLAPLSADPGRHLAPFVPPRWGGGEDDGPPGARHAAFCATRLAGAACHGEARVLADRPSRHLLVSLRHLRGFFGPARTR